MQHGLYHQLAEKTLCQRSNALLARKPSADPRDAHLAGENAEILGREVEELENQILADQKLCGELEHLIRFLTTTKTKSPHRTLALRHLEDAQSRLLRELGDRP